MIGEAQRTAQLGPRCAEQAEEAGRITDPANSEHAPPGEIAGWERDSIQITQVRHGDVGRYDRASAAASAKTVDDLFELNTVLGRQEVSPVDDDQVGTPDAAL